MSKIKFGRRQVQNPTPAAINWWVRLIGGLAGVFGAWLLTVDFIGPKSKNIMNGIVLLVVGIANWLAPFFGTKPKTKYVRAKDVTALETEGGEGGGEDPGAGGSSDPDPSHPNPPKP